jgi:VRR-NUC domain
MRTMNLAKQPKNPNRIRTVVSENIMRHMDPETRKKHGLLLAEERAEKADREAERQMHVEVSRECLRQRIGMIEARMDKRSTITKGHPDFTLMKNNQLFLLELKAANGRLSNDQEDRIAELEQCGNQTVVASSSLEAINAIHAWLDRIGARHTT